MGTAKLGIAVTGLLAAVGATGAFGATITVTTAADEFNGNGECSLREAVIAANEDARTHNGTTVACTAGSGSDTIELPADVGGGDYALTRTGTEATDATVNDLDIDDGSSNDLTIQGVTTAGGSPADPGAVVVHPGSSAFAGSQGNAFQILSPTYLNNLTVRGFSSTQPGGAVYQGGRLGLEKVVFRANQSGNDGGAIYQNRGQLHISQSAFVANIADGGGGAIFQQRDAQEIANTTFLRNHSSAEGGAIRLRPLNGPSAKLDNLTLANNSAAGAGGGLAASSASSSLTVSVRNTLIARNRANGGSPDCQVDSATTVTGDTDFNLVGNDAGCGELTQPGSNNVVDTEARLAAGGDYDGGTPMRPPFTASPAIDAGSCDNVDGFAIITDQRGAVNTRNVDGDGDGTPGCDIGAVERQKVAFTVDDAGDTADQAPGDGACMDASGNCTLRAAIDEANSSAGLDEVLLPAGTITLTQSRNHENNNASGDLDVDGSVIVRGQGAAETTIDADGLDRLFHQTGATTLALSGATLTGGDQGGNGGAVLTQKRGQLRLAEVRLTDNGTSTNKAGGAVYASGADLRMVRTTVDANTAATAGGVALVNGATGLIRNTTVQGNTAGTAGGIDAGAGAELLLESTTVTGNIANPSSASDLYAYQNDSLRVRNSAVESCVVASGGSIASLGSNIEAATSCGFTASGDQQNTSPDLAALADAGGAVPLRVPNANSPAVDAGVCTGANGYILPRRPFGGTRPQDGASAGGSGDGAYDCDVGAAERQQVRAAQGPNPPSARTVSTGASEVVMAQIRLTNEAGEGLDGKTLTVAASGSGDDSADVAKAMLYLDTNSDGQLDAGDTRVDSQTFSSDDGTVTFDLTGLSSPLLSSGGGTVDFLVVYDFATQLAAAGPPVKSPRLAGAVSGGMLAVLGLLGLALSRRGRWLAVPALALALTACGGSGGGGGGGSAAQSETFAVAVDKVEVSGSAGGDVAVRVTPVKGSTVTVEE